MRKTVFLIFVFCACAALLAAQEAGYPEPFPLPLPAADSGPQMPAAGKKPKTPPDAQPAAPTAAEAPTIEPAAPTAAQDAASGIPPAENPPSKKVSPWTLPRFKFSPIITIGTELSYRVGDYQAGIYSAGLFPKIIGGLDLDAGFFGVTATMSINMDGKYSPDLADTSTGTLGKLYYLLDQGGLYSKIGPLNIKVGRFRHYDEVDTPYSLFVNSRGQAAFLSEIRYDDGLFEYMSRWIGLNHDSYMTTDAWGSTPATGPGPVGAGFPERGANIKTIAFRVGEVRFGFQDATVYTGRYFDAEYFFSPLPMYFTQYVRGTGGRPWSSNYDDNNIIGLFVTWDRPELFKLYLQVLIDDFNIHFLFPNTTVWNPWQAAFSLGGRVEAGRAGSFGFYFAGATKFTFEPRLVQGSTAAEIIAQQQQAAYGYSYYPDTRYDGNWLESGFQPRAISFEDNMIGYKYGQNNIAICADWRGRFSKFEIDSYLEFRLAGTNSPANPWHDALGNPVDGTHWFDDPVLEKRIMFGASAAYVSGPWVLRFGIECGVAIDAMELRAPTVASAPNISPLDSGAWIWDPVAGNNKFFMLMKLGCLYRWKLR